MRLLVILFAVYLTRATPAVAPPAVAPLPGPLITAGGHTYAVVRLARWDGEVSNAGGMHYGFSVDGMDPERLVAAGGHGLTGDGLSLPGVLTPPDQRLGDYFIAELTLWPRPVETCAPTWCMDPPRYVGAASHLVPARDLANARALLTAIPRTGYPAGELALLAM